MQKKIGSITSVELAQLCGVSQGTVDRALNDRPGISPKTKERILKTAREHGYIKNMNASFLASGKTKLLGLVVFNFNNEFFAQLAAAVESKARELGYSVIMAVSNSDPIQEKQVVERLLSFGVDGVILCPVGFGDEYDKLLNQYNKPIITIANKAGDSFPFVGVDEVSAMAAMTRRAITAGYEKVGLYIPPIKKLGVTNIYAQKERAKGYSQTVAANNLDEHIIVTEDEAVAFAKQNDKKTALLCASDIYALRLLNRFNKEGVQVPADVGLAGFDNISSLSLFEKQLTTVNYPIEEMGERATEWLVANINGNEYTYKLCDFYIIDGDTLR